MVFSATLKNISVISWRSVLLMEETGVPGENHRPATSHRQTFMHMYLEFHTYIEIIKKSGDAYVSSQYFISLTTGNIKGYIYRS
jgi:uncharacterized damage-inducible protein DinB